MLLLKEAFVDCTLVVTARYHFIYLFIYVLTYTCIRTMSTRTQSFMFHHSQSIVFPFCVFSQSSQTTTVSIPLLNEQGKYQ